MIETKTSLNGKSCITFKQRTVEKYYVYVYSDNGCFSDVSKILFSKYLIRTGPTIFNLGWYDWKKAVFVFKNR